MPIHHKTRDITAILIPIGLLGIPIGLFLWFGNQSSEGFAISPSALNGIVEQIRDNTRLKWIDRVGDIERMTVKIEDIRQKHFERIKAGGQGEAYLTKFKELSKDAHAQIQTYNLNDPKVSLWKVFEAGKNAELRLMNYYRDIRGAQNAIKLEVPASDAIAFVKVVLPQRITLEAQTLDATDYGGDKQLLEAFKKNILNGGSEIDAMVEACKKILKKALEGDSDDKGEGSLVLDNANEFGSRAGDTLRPDELFNSEGTSDGGFKSNPGRIVQQQEDGFRNDWMYINKWYVIGPFENRFRTNLDSAFLPETVVDLDNVTIGKENREIRWEYWVRNKQRIEPSWAPRGAIYYGWTEVSMPNAGKYWVALGSDDYGKMWLNGKLVWKSDSTPKTYRADEYVAEMDFQQGVNQILFRCENAGGTMGWSVVIGTMPNEGGK